MMSLTFYDAMERATFVPHRLFVLQVLSGTELPMLVKTYITRIQYGVCCRGCASVL